MAAERNSLKVIPIDRGRIKKGSNTQFPIYKLNPKYPLNPPNEDYIVLAPKGQEWTGVGIARLYAENDLFIEEKDLPEWEGFVREQTFKLSGETPALIIEKVEDISVHLLEICKNAKIDEGVMAECRNVATGIVDILKDARDIVKHIRTLVEHSTYTYYHSAGVSMLAPAIALEMGETSDTILREYSVGGLLHDIGKLDISLAIINKADALTEQEWQLIRQHPLSGLEKVAHISGISTRIKNMISMHHEKLNGKGYPYKLPAEKIPDEAKILAVADIFNALTTTRSYRMKRTHFEALMLMRHNMHEEIWIPALEALVKVLLPQPNRK